MDLLNILDSISEKITNKNARGAQDDRPAHLYDVNYVIDGLNELLGEVGTASDVASTNLISTSSSIYANLSTLDAAVYVLNNRDVHEEDATHIIKHVLMAVAVYDFDEDGGGTGTIDLNAVDLLPEKAIIKKVYYQVITNLTSAGNTGTFKMKTEEGDISAALTADGTDHTGLKDGVMDGAAANMVILASASKLQAEIGTEDLTAGKVKVFVEYVIGE